MIIHHAFRRFIKQIIKQKRKFLLQIFLLQTILVPAIHVCVCVCVCLMVLLQFLTNSHIKNFQDCPPQFLACTISCANLVQKSVFHQTVTASYTHRSSKNLQLFMNNESILTSVGKHNLHYR